MGCGIGVKAVIADVLPGALAQAPAETLQPPDWSAAGLPTPQTLGRSSAMPAQPYAHTLPIFRRMLGNIRRAWHRHRSQLCWCFESF